MKRTVKIVAAIVLIAIVAYGGLSVYSIYLAPASSDTCIPYLRTNCGAGGNAITYDASTGDITIPQVSQSYGSTWYNVAVAYVPGDPNLSPTAAYFTADPGDFSGNMLSSGQSVTVHNLNATGPAVMSQTYNGSLWIAYTTASGGQSCAGAYSTSSGCQYAQIGTITLKG